MAAPPGLPNLFEVNFTFLRIRLRGIAADVAAAATIGTGLVVTGYWGWKIPNSRRFMKIFQDIIFKRGGILAGLSKGCLVLSVIAEDDEVAQKIEEDCSSGEILKEINAELKCYNTNKCEVGKFDEVKVIDRKKGTANKQQWENVKQEFEKNVSGCIQLGLKTEEEQVKTEQLLMSALINKAQVINVSDSSGISNIQGDRVFFGSEMHFHSYPPGIGQISEDVAKIQDNSKTMNKIQESMDKKLEELLTQQYTLKLEQKDKAKTEIVDVINAYHMGLQSLDTANLQKHIELIWNRKEKLEKEKDNNLFVYDSATEKKHRNAKIKPNVLREDDSVKFIDKELKIYPNAQKELEILKKVVGSDYLLRYVFHESKNETICIKTEACDEDVKECIETNSNCKTKYNLHPVDIANCMIEGIYELHCSYGIVHRDIKPSNFFLKKIEGVQGLSKVKVGDFGLSRVIDEDRSTIIDGTDGYLAPEYREMLEKKRGKVLLDSQVFQGDIFSLGLVLYYVLTSGKHPFGPGPTTQNFYILYNLNLEMNDLYAAELRDEEKINACGLIYWMLSHKPEDRPTMEEVKCHPFLWNYEEKVEFLEIIAKRISGKKILEGKEKSGNIDGLPDAVLLQTQREEEPSTKLLGDGPPTAKVVQGDTVPIDTAMKDSKSKVNWAFEPKTTTFWQKVKKLEEYPVWMSSNYWMQSNPKSNPDEQKKFINTMKQIEGICHKMPSVEEPTEGLAYISQLLMTMTKKKQQADEYPEDARLEFGLGTKRDWKKFYQFFTKDNPQILLRVYQLFGNELTVEAFKKKVMNQDRGPKWNKY